MNATDNPADDGSWKAGLSAAAHVLGAHVPILTHSQRLKLADMMVRAFRRAEVAEQEAAQANREAEAAAQDEGDTEPASYDFGEAFRRLNEELRSRRGAPPLVMPEGRAAHLILGCGPTASPAEVKAAWRLRVKRCHPDTPGGSTDMTAELNAARDAMLRAAGSGPQPQSRS